MKIIEECIGIDCGLQKTSARTRINSARAPDDPRHCTDCTKKSIDGAIVRLLYWKWTSQKSFEERLVGPSCSSGRSVVLQEEAFTVL